jgi:hypothetical protein
MYSQKQNYILAMYYFWLRCAPGIFYLGERDADTEAIYNLCLILKIML